MSIRPVWQETLDFFGSPVVLEPSAGQLSSDAGLLPFRQLDEQLGLTRDFAAVLHDPRDPELIEHTTLEMVRSRVYGILADYADQNDHDTLRYSPLTCSVGGPSTSSTRGGFVDQAARLVCRASPLAERLRKLG